MVTEREDKRGKAGDSWQLERCRRFALLHERWPRSKVPANKVGQRSENSWQQQGGASRCTHIHERLSVKDRFIGKGVITFIQFSPRAEISPV